MTMINEISFSSFLAGMLLMRNEVSYSDINTLMIKFENENNTDIVGECDDTLSDLIICNDFDLKLKLIKDYDEYILYDGKMVTIYDYLNCITNEQIKKYLSINYVVVKDKEKAKILI